MSKGLGHVGRAILAAFEDEPDNAFTTEELCERAYPSTAKYLPERAQRVAVLRAVKRLTALRPDLGIRDWRSEFARGGGIVFHRKYRVLCYAMARLKADYNWKPEAELRAELMPGGRHYEYAQPDGAWTRHTEMEIAKRDGDHEKLEQLKRSRNARWKKSPNALRPLWRRSGNDHPPLIFPVPEKRRKPCPSCHHHSPPPSSKAFRTRPRPWRRLSSSPASPIGWL